MEGGPLEAIQSDRDEYAGGGRMPSLLRRREGAACVPAAPMPPSHTYEGFVSTLDCASVRIEREGQGG